MAIPMLHDPLVNIRNTEEGRNAPTRMQALMPPPTPGDDEPIPLPPERGLYGPVDDSDPVE